MHKHLYVGALAAVLLLAGCGSTDLGSILGGGSTSPTTSVSEVRGIVDDVDVNNRWILLTNVSAYRSSLADSRSATGNTARIYFDNNTTVTYQGRNYRPEDLERGDEVAVQVDDSNGRLIAHSMTVLRDVSGSGTTADSRYDSVVRGTVRHVDTSRREIELDQASWRSGFTTGGSSGRTVIIRYDSQTPVEFAGRTYSVTNLERGDVVDVEVRDTSGSTFYADRIVVVRDVNTSF